jgi:hypothetical protein
VVFPSQPEHDFIATVTLPQAPLPSSTGTPDLNAKFSKTTLVFVTTDFAN